MRKKVVVLGMGGTIAGTAASTSDNVGYRSAQLGVDQLLREIPTLSVALCGNSLEVEQVAQVDSKDIGPVEWTALACRARQFLERPEVAGLIITHGTDTVEETAYFLSQVLPAEIQETKPVVLVCAMRPATSLAPDGPQNVLDAVAVVGASGARGVLVVVAGRIHSALHVQKAHSYQVDAFDSGDAGPVGFVEEGVVRLVHAWPSAQLQCPATPESGWAGKIWPRVDIVTSYSGATGAIVRSLCGQPMAGDPPVRGIVVSGTGNGTIHADLEAALWAAHAVGVKVVRSTRCAQGRVVPGAGSEGAIPHSNGLSPVKARIALILKLME